MHRRSRGLAFSPSGPVELVGKTLIATVRVAQSKSGLEVQ
jgi:hypothetical protein